MIGRKGQGAMEYLMTYGWAILVVMIVGVVLWQLGIFGGGPGATNTASGFGKVKVLEPSIKYSTTNLEFSMMNGVGQGIRGANISSTAGDCETGTSNINAADALLIGTAGVMSAGEVTSVTATNCNNKDSGQSFSVDLELKYATTVAGVDVSKTEVGTIRGAGE